MFTTKKIENIKKLNCYLSQRADILQGIYLLNENILKKRLLKGERIILGVKVDNSFKIIEGVTKQYKNFRKVSVIFGVCQEYQDPSF